MVTFIETGKLIAHEEINSIRLEEVRQDVMTRGILELPLLVDRASLIILDGHHRFRVLQELGKKTVPVLLIDYLSSEIQMFPRRKELPVTKQDVLTVRTTRKLFPEKTTRHVLKFEQQKANVPLHSFN